MDYTVFGISHNVLKFIKLAMDILNSRSTTEVANLVQGLFRMHV